MMRLLLALMFLWMPMATSAQSLQDILAVHADEVAKPSRRSVGILLDDLVASGLPQVPQFLEAWQAKNAWKRNEDGAVFLGSAADGGIALTDIDSGADVGIAAKSELKQLKPNGGVRKEIGKALVQFQLSDPDIERRKTAVEAIARAMSADQLAPLAESVASEEDESLRERKMRLVAMLTALHADDSAGRMEAIQSLAGRQDVETRAVLNRLLVTETGVGTSLPDRNIARVEEPGQDIAIEAAYERLVQANLAAPVTKADSIRASLIANIDGGEVAGIQVASLDTDAQRLSAYARLAEDGQVPPLVTEAQVLRSIADHVFWLAYIEPDGAVTTAARQVLDDIELRVGVSQFGDLVLDGLSLASIYFLAAIGLAITFGVMGVINMAHGEFIMMGAYTGYVVQLFITNYTLSIIVALPLAFAVTFCAGVLMERSVIRWLRHRPLETLLATFGISIALQQLAKNIFGTQARPLTSPGWLDGAWVINDVIQISYIRIAIFVLALIFLALILFVLNRTRLGLEVRAVTQNPGMAGSMGIDPDRINMLTFGLGSGIAGIAGVAIGLYAKVTSEMGADYIVQSFMTVVVGGVGNVWGTLAGATLIGFLQKGIEWFNPSNTLAAQTYMILFIILFIQFRPRGIVALKGRAAAS
ncbi:MAG: urea ABC transporter permease subunit UrtB [Pseudomonadota bacterium]